MIRSLRPNHPGADPRVLVLADDMTGALEVGALFAQRGLTSLVAIKPEAGIEALRVEIQVLVINTESRHLPEQEAFERIRSIALEADSSAWDYLFKKTDSTLRGNLAAELHGLMTAMPGSPLIFAPAYPQLGRTVRDGTLCVHGVPVSQTEFGADLLNPVRESHIPSLIAASRFPAPIQTMPCDGLQASMTAGLYITEASTEDDLHRTARDFLGLRPTRLAAGPAAFARHLANELASSGYVSPEWPGITRCLAINGSRNPVSNAQIAHARNQDWSVYDESFTPASPLWTVLDGNAFAAGEVEAFSDRFGDFAHQAIEQLSAEAAIIFGGDTAAALFKKAGVRYLQPLSEILPGVPAARAAGCSVGSGETSGMTSRIWITKAGGFGDIDILTRIRRLLEAGRQR